MRQTKPPALSDDTKRLAVQTLFGPLSLAVERGDLTKEDDLESWTLYCELNDWLDFYGCYPFEEAAA